MNTMKNIIFRMPDISGVSTVHRFTRPAVKMAVERCDFCNGILNPDHRHLLRLDDRKIICTCDPCALRFQSAAGGRFQLIPREVRVLADFQMTDADWEELGLPINLAFFINRAALGKLLAVYPGPARPVETGLSLDSWNQLVTANPVLDGMKPDVEALLVNRVGNTREYFIAPVDACYELVGVIRQNWRDFSGGETIWDEIKRLFVRLAAQAVPAAREELIYART